MAFSDKELPLSLDEVASILKLNPAHFNQAHGGNSAYQYCSECVDIWCQYPHQSSNGLSREDLAEQIAATIEMMEGDMLLAAPVYPKMKTKRYSIHAGLWGRHGVATDIFPCSYSDRKRPRFFVGDHVVNAKGTKWTVTAASVTVDYLDRNSDSVNETARIIATVPIGTDKKQIGVFIAGNSGDGRFQIRDLSSVKMTNVGAVMEVEILIPAYKMVKRELTTDAGIFNADLVEGCNCTSIDFADATKLIDLVDVSIIEWDMSFPLVKFYSRAGCDACNGAGCSKCALEVADGCYTDVGLSVMPFAATWDNTVGEWVEDEEFNYKLVEFIEISFWECYGLDRLDIPSSEPFMIDQIKRAVSYAAFARLQYGDVDCECTRKTKWRELWREMDVQTGSGRVIDFYKLQNPIGAKRGEWMAWDIIKGMAGGVVVSSGAR